MNIEKLDPRVLGQLLVMQSILNNLPDNESVFSFVCKGLADIPGISRVDYYENGYGKEETSSGLIYPVSSGSTFSGDLLLTIENYDKFSPYKEYLSNFIFMTGIILEERKQRLLNEQHKQLLEKRISERTHQLILEKENLAESERRFSDLMANVNLLSVMLDAKGNIIFCNNCLLELTNYSAGEIMGKNWFDLFIPPDIKTEVRNIFGKIIKVESSSTYYESEILTKSGKRLIISWNNTLLRSAEQKITGTASIGENITDRRKAEIDLQEKTEEIEAQNEEYLQINEELNQINEELILARKRAEDSEEKFRLMIGNSNDTFVLINEKGDQFYISDAAERDTGYTLDELKGPLQNVVFPEDLGNVMEAWEYMLKHKGEAVRVQYRHKHKHKQYIWYEAVAQNFIDNPVINAVVVNIRDITAIKKTETELREAIKKAEESDRLKTAFLQNMSHEIRTPMNAIMGFSNLLVQNFNDKEKLQKFSHIIGKRCNDLLEIINGILDISQIESGQLEVHMEEFDPAELCSELASFFKEYQKRIGKQHIKFKLNSNGLASGTIITDKIKLKQIFINLINNAFKYTQTGMIEGGCKMDDNKNLVFFVSDTGIGIPPDKHKVIFERFVQLKQEPLNNSDGTGLGLSIVKGMLYLLGGEIFLESEPNKGSTFTFTIPWQKPGYKPEETVINEIDYKYESDNKTILIVEDDIFNLEYLKEVLSGAGFTILEAVNGMEAVDKALSREVDLVLMDIRLPDINGYMAAKKIREQKPDLRIIAQTAYASNDDKVKVLKEGFDDYISKPMKQDQLLSVIIKQLKGFK
ncbi:MAG: PAS domain S-box protein [Bacteroidales bacterium]